MPAGEPRPAATGARELARRSAALAARLEQALAALAGETLAPDLAANLERIDRFLGPSDDLIVRSFRLASGQAAAVLYVDGLADEKDVHRFVLVPLMGRADPAAVALRGEELLRHLFQEALPFADLRPRASFRDVVEPLLSGETVLLLDGCATALVLGTRGYRERSVSEPDTESVVRGPRDGFIESLYVNLSLVRRRLRTPMLRVRKLKLGRQTRTDCAVVWIDGVANPELVLEVQRRLEAVDVDAVLESGYLEQLLEDNHLSPFPQLKNTERPDVVVAGLLEGRVAVFADGTPFVLLAPSVFVEFFQSSEDYYSRYGIASLVRFVRLFALVFSLVFPSLYVALLAYHPEMIPTTFAVALAGARAGVPFPAVVEMFVLELSVEILREASVRLPRPIGGALSIIGVLVIGQAAVSAGFANPVTIVVVALTTLGSFATPVFAGAIALRLLRFPLLFLSGLFGLFGVMVGLILITNHVVSLQSFGVPYLWPVAPLDVRGLGDALVRAPVWTAQRRPWALQAVDTRRGDAEPREVLALGRPALDPAHGAARYRGRGDG